MARAKLPITQAMRVLREHGVAWTDPPYAYEPRGGTAVSARELGVDEHAVIKTLVMEDERKRPLIVLMHGDREVSAKNLARTIEVKQIARLLVSRRPRPRSRLSRSQGTRVDAGTARRLQRVSSRTTPHAVRPDASHRQRELT